MKLVSKVVPLSSDNCVYRGSVKDIYQGEDHYLFHFSDRYSIFDWGEMPDLLSGKGASLVQLTKTLFHLAKEQGYQHHLLSLPNLEPQQLAVQICAKSQCQWDAQQKVFRYQHPQALSSSWTRALPLEVVFRFCAYPQSSFWQRLQDISYLLKQGYTREELPIYPLDASAIAPEGYVLTKPIVEFFTKLEPQDRLLTDEEAAAIAGLSLKEIQDLKRQHLALATIWKDFFAQFHIVLGDGKMEWAKQEGTEGGVSSRGPWVLIDSMGPDEMRLIYQGQALSKDILRQYYQSTSWYQNVQRAKKKAQSAQDPFWKNYLGSEDKNPSPLPPELKQYVINMYQALGQLGTKPSFSFTTQSTFRVTTKTFLLGESK